MSEAGNPKDIVRDRILRRLYLFHQSSRSARKVAVLQSELAKSLKEEFGYKQQDVASNLAYLVGKGWVEEVVEKRTFTTPKGTTQNSERRLYKISSEGVDRLEEASLYQQTAKGAHVNITNVNGVVNVGDGNIVNAHFADLSRVLAEARSRLAADPALSDEERLNVISDLDGLSAQLQKPKPNLEVVKALWESVKALGTIGGATSLIDQAAKLILPLIQ